MNEAVERLFAYIQHNVFQHLANEHWSRSKVDGEQRLEYNDGNIHFLIQTNKFVLRFYGEELEKDGRDFDIFDEYLDICVLQLQKKNWLTKYEGILYKTPSLDYKKVVIGDCITEDSTIKHDHYARYAQRILIWNEEDQQWEIKKVRDLQPKQYCRDFSFTSKGIEMDETIVYTKEVPKMDTDLSLGIPYYEERRCKTKKEVKAFMDETRAKNYHAVPHYSVRRKQA